MSAKCPKCGGEKLSDGSCRIGYVVGCPERPAAECAFTPDQLIGSLHDRIHTETVKRKSEPKPKPEAAASKTGAYGPSSGEGAKAREWWIYPSKADADTLAGFSATVYRQWSGTGKCYHVVEHAALARAEAERDQNAFERDIWRAKAESRWEKLGAREEQINGLRRELEAAHLTMVHQAEKLTEAHERIADLEREVDASHADLNTSRTALFEEAKRAEAIHESFAKVVNERNELRVRIAELEKQREFLTDRGSELERTIARGRGGIELDAALTRVRELEAEIHKVDNFCFTHFDCNWIAVRDAAFFNTGDIRAEIKLAKAKAGLEKIYGACDLVEAINFASETLKEIGGGDEV